MIEPQILPVPLIFAATTVDGLLVEFRSLPAGEARVLALVNSVDQNRQLDRAQTSALLQQELQHCHEEGWDAAAAYCEYVLAWLALDRANYAEANRLFERVECAMQHMGDRAYRLRALNGLACVAKDRGNLDSALRRVREALAEAEKADDALANVLRLNIGVTLVNRYWQRWGAPLTLGEGLNFISRRCTPRWA